MLDSQQTSPYSTFFLYSRTYPIRGRYAAYDSYLLQHH